MKDYDVVVIGAGLAGLEVSKSLAISGRKVLLVDAKTSLTERVHTTGIFVRRTLEDFHFPDFCLGPVVHDVSLYSPNGQQIDLHSPHEEFRVGKMATLYESWLEQCRTLGVDVKLSTRFQGSKPLTEGSEIELTAGAENFVVKTRFLVGCDGAQSRVARSLQLSENNKWIVGVETVYASCSSGTHAPRFHCLLDPVFAPGYIAWVVDDGEEIHLGVGGSAKRFEPRQALEEFAAWVSHHLDIKHGDMIEERGGRIPVGGLLPRIINQHGCLIGDAAGAVSPLTAGGLDPCLRMSKMAATVIDDFLTTGNTQALLQYNGAKIRKRFWKRLLLRKSLELIQSRRLMNFAWPILNSIPGRAFAKKVMFGRGSFPDVTLSVQNRSTRKPEQLSKQSVIST